MFTECVIGYRHWRLDAWVLRPRTVGPPWRPGVNTAFCDTEGAFAASLITDPEPHTAPGTWCDCGLYALHEPAQAAPWGSHIAADVRVFGAIAAWGDLRVHHAGFRAQHAQIVALAYTQDMSLELRKRIRDAALVYRCEYVPAHRLPEVAARYGSPLPESARPEKPPSGVHVMGVAQVNLSAARFGLVPVATGGLARGPAASAHLGLASVGHLPLTFHWSAPPDPLPSTRSIRQLRRYAREQAKAARLNELAGDLIQATEYRNAEQRAHNQISDISRRRAKISARLTLGSIAFSSTYYLLGWLI